MESSLTYQEIMSQPEVLAASLRAVEEQAGELLSLWKTGYDRVIFTGCGSTYYLSLTAAVVFQELNDVLSTAIPGGELWLSPRYFSVGGVSRTLLVAVSRSGATTETVRAVESFKATGEGSVLTVTTEADSPLNHLGDVGLVLPAAREQSVVQTRAFTSMHLATLALTAVIGGWSKLLDELRDVPGHVAGVIENYHALMEAKGRDLSIDRIYFLGSGLHYGLACEGSLKMKEMALTHTEPFHFLEFRHGPKSMLSGSALVVGLLSDSKPTRDVLDEAHRSGGQILAMGDEANLPAIGDSVAFAPGLSAIAGSLRYIPALQLMALARAEAKGLSPDKPRNLTAVVELDPGVSG